VINENDKEEVMELLKQASKKIEGGDSLFVG